MTTAPLLGFTCMVNSFFRPKTGVILDRPTVTSTCSPGSTKSPEPMIQLVVQKQYYEPDPDPLVQFRAWS